MRPNFEIVKQLVTKHLEVIEQERLLSSLGIQIDFLGKLDLLDIAMDIVGIPQENSEEFDFDALNGINNPDSGKRKDFNNMFCRDGWGFSALELKKEDIDSFVLQLYKEYDELILARPHLFVKE